MHPTWCMASLVIDALLGFFRKRLNKAVFFAISLLPHLLWHYFVCASRYTKAGVGAYPQSGV